ncbi:hypothetical protein PILCRDRAFT_90532 [Piloderma croceum F 1598]|uniref:Uncharacterized protein n=1 Tax=Piloderma croceum (strain F 1598) TaxID=765440 RepID=A0A0C3AX29_PILCF|nr:hypothetical protein PILCRDRAFT_90532 [Piloderma croceum F 1598]
MAPFAYSDFAPSKLLTLHQYKKLRTDHSISPRQSSTLEILSFFMIGCAIALSHHSYYSYLSYKSVERTYSTPIHAFSDQKWASHVGSALAFATKFFFAKADRGHVPGVLDGLDAGFDVLHNLQGFLSLDLISSAQRLILLALMSWAMPLIAIITPGALLVVSHNVTAFVSPCAVPSVDLSTWASSATLCLYDNVSFTENQYLASPSPQAQQLATLALLSGTYAVPESACGPVCDYSTSFFAPYFNCTKPFNIGKPSNYSGGVYFWNATSVANSTNAPDQLYIDWFGDRQAAIVGGPPNPAQNLAQRVICSATNASYTLHVQHNGSYTSVTPQSITPVNNFSTVYDQTGHALLINPNNTEPMVYSSIFQAVTSILDGTVLNGSSMLMSSGSSAVGPASVLLPRQVSGSLSPQDGSAHYQDAYTGQSAQQFSSTMWNTSVQINQTMVTLGTFGYMNTTAQEWIPFSNIGQKVEGLMLNISIGLMVLNIQGSSSKQISTSPTSASVITCTQHPTENVYLYRPMVLWVPYLTAFICTLFAVLVGLHALWRNPSKGSTGFKTMLAATRNTDPTFIAAVGGEKVDGGVRLRFVDYESDGMTLRRVFEVVPESISTEDQES